MTPPFQLDPAADPRPDLESDTALWSRLLAASYLLDGDRVGVRQSLHWSLNGLRCCGAALERKPDGSIRLLRGEIEEPDWRGYRERWLVPHDADLRRLLRDLATDLKKMEEVA